MNSIKTINAGIVDIIFIYFNKIVDLGNSENILKFKVVSYNLRYRSFSSFEKTIEINRLLL